MECQLQEAWDACENSEFPKTDSPFNLENAQLHKHSVYIVVHIQRQFVLDTGLPQDYFLIQGGI